MTRTKAAVWAFMLASLFGPAASRGAAAAEINWLKYMQSSATVSAIAVAVAFVDNCSKKLKIEEASTDTGDGGTVTLSFLCEGKEDEEAAAIVKFQSFSDGVLVPMKFDYAG